MAEHEFNFMDFQNEEDQENTALHYATKHAKPEVINFLLLQ